MQIFQTFAMFLHILERLEDAQRLIHASSHWQVIHQSMANLAVRINQEQAAKSHETLQELRSRCLLPVGETGFFIQNAEIAGNFLAEVG